MRDQLFIYCLFASVSLLAGCDLARESEVRQQVEGVARGVSEVASRQVSFETEVQYAVSAQTARIAWLEQRQRDAEVVIEAMGDGFNVLGEAVEEVDDRARTIEARQERLADRVETLAAPPLQRLQQQTAPEDEIPMLTGSGEDIRTGESLETLWLVLDDPPLLRRADEATGAFRFLPVRETGRRLYAGDAASKEWLCLDLLDNVDVDAGEGFSAADCEQPWRVWTFVLP